MSSDFLNELYKYKALTENKLSLIFKELEGSCPKNIVDAMSYSVLNGGKRIRSFLTIECCRAMGGNIESSLITACAIEMVHAYSLVHDDLPAMDNDDLRRGIPSCHKKFSESLAILAGDGLQTLAYEILSSEENIKNIGFKNALKCIGVISKCIGEKGMLGGQVVDILNENKKLSKQDHLNMVSMKTGALIRASVHCGCILANANNEDLTKALEFSNNLGIAFQIKDDILDATGNVEQLGKSVRSDEKCHKNTFVSIYGLEKAIEISEFYHKEALKALNIMNCEKAFLESATYFLAKRNF